LSDIPRGFLRHPVHFLSFGFGAGLSPKAPGTLGTVVGLILFIPLQLLPLPIYLIVLCAAFGFGVWMCEYTSKALGVHDHGGIVWDEFVGLWIALILVPDGWIWLLAGFGLFRLFDIWKPQPIRALDERVHGGFGIMIDDVIAGVYALIVIQLLAYLVGG